jgi:hypothetical protein
MSCTLVLKNLPHGCTDSDIRRAAMPFGTVVELQMYGAQNEAAVTLQTPQQADALLRARLYINECPVTVESSLMARGGAAPRHGGSSTGGVLSMPGSMASNAIDVNVGNAKFPITSEILQRVFGTVGTVQSCNVNAPIVDARNVSSVVATVTFATTDAAASAVTQFKGKSIYPGCCLMDVSIARVAAAPVILTPHVQQQLFPPPAAQHAPLMHQPLAPVPQPVIGGHPLVQPPPQAQPLAMPPLMQMPPAPMQHAPFMPPGMPGGYSQQMMGMPPFMGQQPMMQQPMMPTPMGQQPMMMPMAGRGGRGAARGRGVGRGGADFSPFGTREQMPNHNSTSVIIVCGVPLGTSLQTLFVLLELYGNVNGLKRLAKSPEQVVAKFQHDQDARTAAYFLSNCPYYGSRLAVRTFMGYDDRTPFHGEPDDDPSDDSVHTYDFTHAHHRSRHGAAQHQNNTKKLKPSQYLFVANLTEEISDDDVRDMFIDKECPVNDIARKSSATAIVELDDTAAAVIALIKVHSYHLRERYIRVIFSCFSPHSLPPSVVAAQEAEKAAMEKGDGANGEDAKGDDDEVVESAAPASS